MEFQTILWGQEDFLAHVGISPFFRREFSVGVGLLVGGGKPVVAASGSNLVPRNAGIRLRQTLGWL